MPSRRRIRSILLCVLLSSTSLAIASPDEASLQTLATQLKQARAATGPRAAENICPSDTRKLIGISEQDLKMALGEPDGTHTPAIGEQQDGPVWVYVFASTQQRTGMLGGGFPEIHFEFDRRHKVSRVDCHYAR